MTGVIPPRGVIVHSDTGTSDIRRVPWETGNTRATHRARARDRALDMEAAARARARATVESGSSVDFTATNLRLL